MKTIFKTVLWSVGIGTLVSLVGILLFKIIHNLSLEYWFMGFGALMIFAAGLPFLGGSQSAREDVWFRPNSYMDDYKESRQAFALSKWTIITFLIGLSNLIIPFIVIKI